MEDLTDDFDERELTAVEILRQSPGWALVAGRIARKLDTVRNDLERESDPAKAAVLRGRAYECRVALQIPNILADELRQQQREEERRGK